MKNIKLVIAVIALFVFPFFAKAQTCCQIQGPPALIVKYIDHGYGQLTCTAKSGGFLQHSYTQYINNGSSSTFYTVDPYWISLSLSAGGVDVNDISFSDLESQSIGVDYPFSLVPTSPYGVLAPQFTITRNSAYNYTVTTWLTPQ